MTHTIRKRSLSLLTAATVVLGSASIANADQPVNTENVWSEQSMNDLDQAFGEISPDATPPRDRRSSFPKRSRSQ